VIAGVNVIGADTDEVAQEQFLVTRRARLRRFLLKPDVSVPDAEVDRMLASSQGAQIERMMEHTMVGTPDAIRVGLERFAEFADADELMICHQAPTIEGRLRSLELTAASVGLASN
jgi:alkanesulfonate monooxygenase SsuD/methylene tetrahydromethanopterin reductase-like flavin-dependent oxidoreductase (luciferase family)